MYFGTQKKKMISAVGRPGNIQKQGGGVACPFSCQMPNTKDTREWDSPQPTESDILRWADNFAPPLLPLKSAEKESYFTEKAIFTVLGFFVGVPASKPGQGLATSPP